MEEDSATHMTAAFAGYRAQYPEAAALLDAPLERWERLGYGHTLLEILQQPETWLETAGRTMRHADQLAALLQDCCFVVLTGSAVRSTPGSAFDCLCRIHCTFPCRRWGPARCWRVGQPCCRVGRPA